MQTSQLFLKYLVKESLFFLSVIGHTPHVLTPTFSWSLNLAKHPFSVASLCLPHNKSLSHDIGVSSVMYMLSFVTGSKSKVIPTLDDDEGDKEPLLGLQRVMRDAHDPRRPVIGSWLMFPGASIARMHAQMGYDFIVIDCEHGNIDDAAMHAAVGAVAAEGVSPLVRIAGAHNVAVKRALDSGAHGILCPSISTPEEAMALVTFAKFPAQSHIQNAPFYGRPSVVSGTRGVGSPFAPAVFKQNMAEYIRTANRNTFIAVQIENIQGLENCELIAKVEGIDMLFIGPNDLASAMGYPALDNESIEDVQEAVTRILAAAHAAGKYAGMFCTTADQVRNRYNQGFDLMNLGGDVVALQEWNSSCLDELKDIRN